jgi:hypothetical protein
MHQRVFFSALLCFIATAGGIGADSVTPPEAPAKRRAAHPLDALKQGDPVAKLRGLLGEPVEARPMKAPSGKAEVWVYLNEVSRRMDRIDRSTSDIVINVTESDGSVRQKITPGQVRFEDVHYVTEDVIEVLLFNDHYVLHKIARRERKL